MLEVFVDTNVLVYAFDGSEPRKQQIAQDLIDGTDQFVLSTQVLLEFFVVVTRKLRPALQESAARSVVAALAELPVVTTDAPLVLRAIDVSIRHHLSIWDAMIIQAASESGCSRLWTEDLDHGATILGVEIVDPFRS